jgi:hypothetical protein
VDEGLGADDSRADAARDADSLGAAFGAAVPQAHTAIAVTKRAATARTKPGSLVRSGNPQPFVLGDTRVSPTPGRNQ